MIALDILRTENREPEVAAAVLRAPDGPTSRACPAPREAAGDIMLALHSPEAEARARFIAERLFALAADRGARRSAPPEIAEAWALTRLAAPPGMIGANDLGRGR